MDAENYAAKLTTPIRQCVRKMHQQVLYGDEIDENDIEVLLNQCIAEIERIQDDRATLRGHTHDFGPDDYCRFCGLDARF